MARFRDASGIRWGVVREDRLFALDHRFETTGELLRHGGAAVRGAYEQPASRGIELRAATLLSPITDNQRIICLGKNYRAHTTETGSDPDAQTFNMMFRKASSCLCGASAEIVRPKKVRLLDYEVELGLVIGRDLLEPETFEGPGLPDAIGALVVHNDVSARDIQVPQGQFYKGKSFRTFGPTGPWLTLLDEVVKERWHELRLETRVNGEVRQRAICAEMVHGPAETLTELCEIQSLSAGDLIASGTPAGVAMQRTAAQNAWLDALPAPEKWAKFVEFQEASGRYLVPGDRVKVTIRTDDGVIDLGALDNRVCAG